MSTSLELDNIFLSRAVKHISSECYNVCVYVMLGDLYFSYVKTTDANAEGYVYKCNVFNPFLDLTTTGAYSRLHVIPS